MTSLPLFPNGGWDVHHHIFEPARFSYAPDRHLTPPPATIQAYIDFKRKLGLTNSVLTHGLSYGADCSSLTTFTSDLGTSTRAIAVIDPDTTTPAQLQAMQDAGIRGIRVNLYRYGAMHDVSLQKTALREHAQALSLSAHCARWSMAFTHTHPEFWGPLTPLIEGEIVPRGIKLVTDHFALLKGASMLPAGVDVSGQDGLSEILDLVRAGYLYVKISAPYRVSTRAPDYADLKPLVRAFLDANPRQVLWGSDWPHTPPMKVRTHEEAMKETPFLEINDLAWLKSLRSWMSAREWHMVMVTNPQSLYVW